MQNDETDLELFIDIKFVSKKDFQIVILCLKDLKLYQEEGFKEYRIILKALIIFLIRQIVENITTILKILRI